MVRSSDSTTHKTQAKEDSQDRLSHLEDAENISISIEGDGLAFVEETHLDYQALKLVPSRCQAAKLRLFKASSINLSTPPTIVITLDNVQSSGEPVVVAAVDHAVESGNFQVAATAEIPDVETAIATVKRLSSWFPIFISRDGWVCVVELSVGASEMPHTIQKHSLYSQFSDRETRL